jgi:uncharacterized protein
MPLCNLPTESILDIADRLNNAGLNALARTNSQIYQFLNKYLYRRDVTREMCKKSRSLTWAIKNGMEATAQWAADAGGHLDPIPESFQVALADAASQGDVSVVTILLKINGINPNCGGWRSAPPLVLAAENGHSAVVGLLLALGNIDPNIGDTDNERPLHRAIKSGHTTPIRQLLARDDIDVNAVGDWGETPLLKAIEIGNMEVINLLLSKDGIEINFLAPLLSAIIKGRMEVVDSLFARDNLDLNTVDRRGDHLLLYAAWFGLGLDKVKLILDRTNVNPDFVGTGGHTAFIIACRTEHENLELIEFLVEQGINVNRQGGASMLTGFCYAVFHGRFKIIKFLLNRDDVDHNRPDSRGNTPLFYSIARKHLSVVDMLLQKDGIDVNARNIVGSTALANTCADTQPNDHTVDSVRLLLSHPDIDPNILDNNGVSALSRVIELRRTGGTNQYRERIESLLRAAGAR